MATLPNPDEIDARILLRTGVGDIDFDRFRELRRRFRLRQTDVPEWAGVNRSTIAQWELGRKKPSPEHARTLAAVLAHLERRATQGRSYPPTLKGRTE
jgi:DNA-binding XRE family transcriptional regulator